MGAIYRPSCKQLHSNNADGRLLVVLWFPVSDHASCSLSFHQGLLHGSGCNWNSAVYCLQGIIITTKPWAMIRNWPEMNTRHAPTWDRTTVRRVWLGRTMLRVWTSLNLRGEHIYKSTEWENLWFVYLFFAIITRIIKSQVGDTQCMLNQSRKPNFSLHTLTED